MKIYGLIGFPLGHSFSKKYFTEKFQRENISDALFELFPIESIDHFEGLIKENSNIKGIAVTIPYKQAVISFLHELSHDAAKIGAVNCIAFSNGKSIGYNTDFIGFKESFIPAWKPEQKKALILGSGGASKAIQYTFQQLGIEYKIVSRVASKSNFSYSDITTDILTEYTIIVNCTPLGMTPKIEAYPPIPYKSISGKHYCYDLIYTPAETTFLKKCKERGATIKNGYDMLVIQAEENWKIWQANQ